VTAVIYTHSHVDHFGGVVDADTNVPVIAPEHFVEHAVSENTRDGAMADGTQSASRAKPRQSNGLRPISYRTLVRLPPV
jgi:alkyl sulfatase BDS1-like metallo-beta-lactamase superfamily hydrolase